MRGKEAGRADGKKDVVIGERKEQQKRKKEKCKRRMLAYIMHTPKKKEQKRKRKSASGACWRILSYIVHTLTHMTCIHSVCMYIHAQALSL